jgi:signal transduction histidine kinase
MAKSSKNSEYENQIRSLQKKISVLEERLLIKHSERLKKNFDLEFFGQMSHEMRTPVNIIINTVDLLKDQCLKESDSHSNELVTILNSACKRLHRTIDTVMHITEIQSGTYIYEPVAFDLFLDLKAALFSDFQQRAKDKDLEFKWVKKSEDTSIFADAYCVTQIFFHVIENAVKFTNFGKVEVEVSGSKSNLRVKVIDTGIGISEKFLPFVFEPFSQEDRGYARRFEGNGLGLTLVKKYCELISADIKIKSEKGIGSTITIRLPRKKHRTTK